LLEDFDAQASKNRDRWNPSLGIGEENNNGNALLQFIGILYDVWSIKWPLSWRGVRITVVRISTLIIIVN